MNSLGFKGSSTVIAGGGTGYAVDDEVVLSGGTYLIPITLTVTAVTLGVITTADVTTAGRYTTKPSNPVSQASTTGSGSGATFTITWADALVFTDAAGVNLGTSLGASEYAVGTILKLASEADLQSLIDTNPFVPRSYLAGCTMSTAGSSATMSIAAGVAVDTTTTAAMTLVAIAKTTSAWAVGTGNGGLDTGTIANSTWYHFFVIQRVDTDVVDVVFSATSTPASGPTVLPTNYTLYRRIGSGLTNGSAQWTAFIQDGNWFEWLTYVQDVAVNTAGTSAVTRTLTVPPNVNLMATFNSKIIGASNETVYFSDLATTDSVATNNNGQLTCFSFEVTQVNASGQVTIRTNTSKQIRSRCAVGGAGDFLYMNTVGWTDSRGQNA